MTTPGRRAEQAKALAVVLAEEFGVPFAFCDPATGRPVFPEDAPALPASEAQALAAGGRPRVEARPDGRFRLSLPFGDPAQPRLLAVGALAALCPNPFDSGREQGRLQKWLQAVADRLRLGEGLHGRRRSEEGQHALARTAWETILTVDQLLRRLRIHREPVANQQRVLRSARELLGVEALAWVPHHAGNPVVVDGAACLAPADARHLAELLAGAEDCRPDEPFFGNDPAAPWAGRFPQVRNLLAFTVKDQGETSWVLAINKKDDAATLGQGDRETRRQGDKETVRREDQPDGPVSLSPCLLVSLPPCVPFRRSDAALLTPFVGLLEMYQRASTRYQDLKGLLVGLTRSLTAALDAKDSYTFGHSERVARIALELGRELGLRGEELSDLYLAGLLHDVGKIGVRDAVLCKPGPLTVEEFEHIKQHVTIGYAILADLHPIRTLLPGVLYHHERYDGQGYPDGLAGEAIPLLARILAVADAYDAMRTTRPYRNAMPARQVEEVLTQGAGTQWDKRVVDAFLRCRHRVHGIRQRGVGESLQLALDGVLRANRSATHGPAGAAGPAGLRPAEREAPHGLDG